MVYGAQGFFKGAARGERIWCAQAAADAQGWQKSGAGRGREKDASTEAQAGRREWYQAGRRAAVRLCSKRLRSRCVG